MLDFGSNLSARAGVVLAIASVIMLSRLAVLGVLLAAFVLLQGCGMPTCAELGSGVTGRSSCQDACTEAGYHYGIKLNEVTDAGGQARNLSPPNRAVS